MAAPAIDFSDLLDKSRALRSKQAASASLHTHAASIPRLERALPQIDRESRRLAASHAPAATLALPSEANGLRLLSEHGFRPDVFERDLRQAALHPILTPPATPVPADPHLDAYIARAHEAVIASAVHDALVYAKDASGRAVAAALDAEWRAAKKDLVALPAPPVRSGRARPGRRVGATAPGGAFASPFRFPRGGTGGRAPGPGRVVPARPVVSVYEATVRKAVHARARPEVAVAVATELDEALVGQYAPRGDVLSAGKGIQHLHSVFSLLRYVVGEAGAPTAPREGVFGGMYGVAERQQCHRAALRFLCLQFREDKMRREIQMRPVEARRGGVPGMHADVKAYLNLIFDRGVPDQLAAGTMHQGLPIWPQVYYCLRAGSRETALEILGDALRGGCTDGSVILIEQCLKASLATPGDRGALPNALLERLVQEYGLSVQRGEDPYQRACYVVLGRLDPAAGDKLALLDSDYSLLFYSIEDYLWMRLSIVRLAGDEKAPESLAMYELSMKSIQEEVRSFGPAHFDPQGDTPTFYALVLLLTGQFSEAIGYLDRGARAITEATHIAYVLYYYGILRETGEMDIGMEDDANFRFDYAGLLWRYVCRFSRSDPTAAAVYVFTLRDGGVRKELLRKLLLETKEFDMLLGSKAVRDDARGVGRQAGVLEELWPLGGRDGDVTESWISIVEEAAGAAEEAGDRASAVQLYDVAGARGKVVGILIDKLSAELTSRNPASRERTFREAMEYRQKLEKDGIERMQGDVLLRQLLPSLDLLLAMGEFFELVWAKQFERAWELLDKVDFLPRTDEQLVSKVSELRVGGGVWADGVCDRVAEMVVAAMEVVAGLHAMQRRSGREIGGSGLWSAQTLRAAAKTLVNFSGMMPNVSADVSARLVRLDVLMN